LTVASVRAVLDVNGDDVADASSVSNLTLAADHGGAAGAGVIGNLENGAQLNHGRPPEFVG
jgi:hypothetical protein